MIQKNKKEIIYSVFILVLPITGLFSFAIYLNINTVKEQEVESLTKEVIEIKKEPTINPEIMAEGAYVKNLNSGGIIFQKNSDKILPLASLTKIMTALVALNNISDSQVIKIKDTDIATEGESFLSINESFKLKDAVDFMMLTSSNDAASAIASSFTTKKSFIDEMNFLAKKLGLLKTNFANETGLDISENNASAYSTAKEIAELFEYAYTQYPFIFEKTNKESFQILSNLGIKHLAKNTNSYTHEMPGLLASKTGYTDIAGGNLAVIVDLGLNQTVLIVVLGSTYDGRFQDVINIIKELKSVI